MRRYLYIISAVALIAFMLSSCSVCERVYRANVDCLKKHHPNSPTLDRLRDEKPRFIEECKAKVNDTCGDRSVRIVKCNEDGRVDIRCSQ